MFLPPKIRSLQVLLRLNTNIGQSMTCTLVRNKKTKPHYTLDSPAMTNEPVAKSVRQKMLEKKIARKGGTGERSLKLAKITEEKKNKKQIYNVHEKMTIQDLSRLTGTAKDDLLDLILSKVNQIVVFFKIVNTLKSFTERLHPSVRESIHQG